ncbi:MAG: hypothetical protein RMZ43_002935 [Nostoc sp. CmiVER01]|uniref:hypothetical protein n=1 Tax=Nostoc sp. CmiVER01 TaxID=3075384 RepID=UPI002AD35FC4|nr:hypothetical protein [Nostoc sp. CmiVER01]MDZ8124756.1 hypothetical protein [Nostoc sp. CmiVER01]
MTKIALPNGQYADQIIAAQTGVGGTYKLPDGTYAQTVVPVDANGNVIVDSGSGGSSSPATSTAYGTVKTNTTSSTPVVYLSSEVDTLNASNVNLAGTQTVSGAKTFSNVVNITNSTASSSTTTGSLVTAGGMGVGGAITAGSTVQATAYLTPNTGLGNPTYNTRSPGTKFVFYPNVNATNVDYGIGVSGGTFWLSVPSTSQGFYFFGGTTSTANISGTGVITGTQFRLSALNTAPTSATDTGTAGEIRIDANYIYFCTNANTWKRTALSTW